VKCRNKRREEAPIEEKTWGNSKDFSFHSRAVRVAG